MSNLLILFIVIPFLSGLLSTVGQRYLKHVLIITILLMASNFYLLFNYLQTGNQLILFIGGWHPPLGIALFADKLIAIILLNFGIIFTIITFFYISSKNFNTYNYTLILFWWGTTNASILSIDLFNIYVTIELATLISIIMISSNKTKESLNASFKYLIIMTVASLLFIMGAIFFYFVGGNLYLLKPIQDPQKYIFPYTLLIISIIIKSGLTPFHFWLPEAHATAPSFASGILSGIMVKIPIIALFKVVYYSGLFLQNTSYLFLIFGSLSVLYGGWIASKQEKVKNLLASSTISNIGYIFLFFSFSQNEKFIFILISYILSHSLVKSALFLMFDNMKHLTISEINSTHFSKLSLITLLVASLILIGLPPSLIFWGKFYGLKLALEVKHMIILLTILFGTVLSLVYSMKLFQLPFKGVEVKNGYTSYSKIDIFPFILTLVALSMVVLLPILGNAR